MPSTSQSGQLYPQQFRYRHDNIGHHIVQSREPPHSETHLQDDEDEALEHEFISDDNDFEVNEEAESENQDQDTYADQDDSGFEGEIDEVLMEFDQQFDPSALGLKEIGNLASWTVSSCKPGCGVEALRDEDTNLFWQSDGPQPHHINIHFSRLVSIRSIRIFLDFDADESYTPTRIIFLAGTGYHDVIPFHTLNFEHPRGWISVPLDQVGGGEDRRTLKAFLLQIKVLENHQNGKDTHVRGLKVYAKDEKVGVALGDSGLLDIDLLKVVNVDRTDRGCLIKPDWIGDPLIR